MSVAPIFDQIRPPPLDDRRPALPALTGIRAFAALGPILWHALVFTQGVLPFSRHGYLGVDFFFMLSGFVLAYVHGEEMRRPSWTLYRRFLALRLGRIWPAYVVVLLAIGVSIALREQWWTQWATPVQQRFVVHLLMLQSWGLVKPNEFNWPGWSVSAEWFVYLLFPIFVLCLLRVSRSAALIAVPSLVAALALIYILTGHPGVLTNDTISLVRAAFEFAAGFLLWRLFDDAAIRQWNWRLIGTACLAALALLLAFTGPGSAADFCFVAVFAPLLLSLAYGRGPLARICAWRPIVFLGEISYAVYLVHFPIIFKIGTLMDQYGVGLPDWAATAIATAGTVLVSVVAGIALHFIVERPCRRFVRRRLGQA